MKSQQFFPLIFLLIALLGACDTSKTGTIEGILLNGSEENEDQLEPLMNARIVLCKITENGLPEGPAVSEANEDNLEEIGVLLAEPTVLTDSDGEFVLEQVPAGKYLVLFHLFPGELQHQEWHDAVLTEASIILETGEIPASGKPDFWEEGGLSVANADWSSQEGLTAVEGSICSHGLGFCFLVQGKRPYPVVDLNADSTVNVKLVTLLKPN